MLLQPQPFAEIVILVIQLSPELARTVYVYLYLSLL